MTKAAGSSKTASYRGAAKSLARPIILFDGENISIDGSRVTRIYSRFQTLIGHKGP
jgi:hypothetical protein